MNYFCHISDNVSLNIGQNVWLNAYWYTFLPSGLNWNKVGHGHNGKGLVGDKYSYWVPDPLEGTEENFCGTYGTFSDIANHNPGFFKDGLKAIRCDDSNTKGFVAKNICVKEAANICDMPNSNQVTTPPTTDQSKRKKRNAKSSIYKLEPTAIDLAFDPLLKYTGKQLLMKRRNELKKNFQAMNFTKSYKLVLHFYKETVNILIFSLHSFSGTCLRFYGKLSCRALMSTQKILAPLKRDPC